MGSKYFSEPGVYVYQEIIPVAAGDKVMVDWLNANVTDHHSAIAPPKFESVMVPNSSYPFADIPTGMYEIYVSPSGNNSNDGRTAATPLQTIEQAFTNASKVALTSRGAIRINLAAGEYTLTPNYLVREFNTPILVRGTGSVNTDVTINVSGTTYGWEFLRANVEIQLLTIKGTLTSPPSVGSGLLLIASSISNLVNLNFVGTDKTNSYAGLTVVGGEARISSATFTNLPIAIENYGSLIDVVWPNSASSGNDIFYRNSGGITNTPLISPSQYTVFKVTVQRVSLKVAVHCVKRC
jgi:hypothetical protein